MRRSHRLAAGAATLTAVVGVLTGCGAVATVCPAIGYIDTVRITVEGGAADRVERVELCMDGVCGPSRAASDAGLMLTPPTVSGTTWTFTGSFPDGLAVHLYAADGLLLSVSPLDADWQRTGGTAECGGPHEGVASVRT